MVFFACPRKYAVLGVSAAKYESGIESGESPLLRGEIAMIRLIFALAVGAFVLSLPIHMTALGATLRRIAGFCFVLALVPSLVVGLFFPGGVEAHPVAVALTIAVLSMVAFGILYLRAKVFSDEKPRSRRIQEKTPLDRTRRREQDFFAFIADRQSPPEE